MSSIIAITGGIGSGKSIISMILRIMGYFVYDCDSEAKSLMDKSLEIKNSLKVKFGNDIFFQNGEINRNALSMIVFADKDKLNHLNAIVHSAVKRDIIEWVKEHKAENKLFIETAILNESNLGGLMDEIWYVDAPIDIRIKRVMLRNRCTENEVKARISVQNSNPLPNYKIIINDNVLPVLPQVFHLINNDAKKCKEFDEF